MLQPNQTNTTPNVFVVAGHQKHYYYQVADVEACQRLCSASSSSLIVDRTRLSVVRDRAFLVAAACFWNSLPEHVTFAVFRSHLKTHLFSLS